MSIEANDIIPLEELGSMSGPIRPRRFSVATHTSTAGESSNNEYMTFRPLPLTPRRRRPRRWRLQIKKKHLFICVMLILLSILALGSVSVTLLKMQETADRHVENELQKMNGIESRFVQKISDLQHQIQVKTNQSESRLAQTFNDLQHQIQVQTNESESRLVQKIEVQIDGIENRLANKIDDLEHHMTSLDLPKDCSALAAEGETSDGSYTIAINGLKIQVYCEFIDGDGWLVFQRRFSGEKDFFKGWNDYKEGFGNIKMEFWLGLEILNRLTTADSYILRVDLENWDNDTAYAEYSSFVIANSTDNYRLHIGTYDGTAGDSLTYHNGQPFTTKDKDNDAAPNGNCALWKNGAWWYKHCGKSNLNGKYCEKSCSGSFSDYNADTRGMIWISWTKHESMKATKLKIKRNLFPPS